MFKHLRRFVGPAQEFQSSSDYWERRYRDGGNSGEGSYGEFAEFKATVLNQFVSDHKIRGIVEFGCGDGHQLKLAKYNRYLGVDISWSSIQRCRKAFAGDASKAFIHLTDPLNDYFGLAAQCAVSLDVIYHLVEDEVYENYMRRLFSAATEHVVIYSTNLDAGNEVKHVRHRKFTDWVEREEPFWKLTATIKNTCHGPQAVKFDHHADFFFYQRAA